MNTLYCLAVHFFKFYMQWFKSCEAFCEEVFYITNYTKMCIFRWFKLYQCSDFFYHKKMMMFMTDLFIFPCLYQVILIDLFIFLYLYQVILIDLFTFLYLYQVILIDLFIFLCLYQVILIDLFNITDTENIK